MLGAVVNAGWNQLSESNKQGTKVMAEVKHWHFDSAQPTKTEAMEIPRSQHDVSMHDVWFRLWFSVFLCRLVGNLGTDMNNKTGSYNLLLGWQKGYPLRFFLHFLQFPHCQARTDESANVTDLVEKCVQWFQVSWPSLFGPIAARYANSARWRHNTGGWQCWKES